MNIAFPALIISIYLLPGFIFANRVLVLDGNSSTDRPFSTGLLLALVVAPLIHWLLISFANLLSFIPPIIFDLNNFFKLINSKPTSVNYPSLFQIFSYIFSSVLFSSTLGNYFSYLRELLLYESVSTNNKWLYQIAKYNSDWFNFFKGWSSLLPENYLSDDDINKNNGSYNKIAERDVVIMLEYMEENQKIAYIGSVVDFTPSKTGELYSMILDVVGTSEGDEIIKPPKPKRMLFFSDRIIRFESYIFDYTEYLLETSTEYDSNDLAKEEGPDK